VRLGGGDGLFGPAVAYKSGRGPFGVTLADINRDGKLDIAVANYGGGSVSLLLGSGDGAFSMRSRYKMGSFGGNVDTVVVDDFDRDGYLDIATPEMFGPVVRRGRGDGTFLGQRRLGQELYSQGGAVADFNSDGWPDLAFSGTCDGPDCAVNWVFVFVNWTGQPAEPCVVPDVTHKRLRAATSDIEYRGCRRGHVSHRHSRTVRDGRVISQRPAYNEVVPGSGPVDLVVSG
jgi:hypothetical protein